jgi:hypothetical protein
MKSQLQIMLYSFLGFAGLEQASVVGSGTARLRFGSVASRSCERTVPDRRAAKGGPSEQGFSANADVCEMATGWGSV